MDMNENTQWWLATLGRTIIWARLRVLDAGTAEVFDSDGNTLPYDSEDSAHAEFTAIDGMDEDDADARGFTLQELTPPQADDDAKLRALMVQKLPTRN